MVWILQEDLYGPAHLVGWEPYDLPDLAYASGVGSVLAHTDPAEHLVTTATGSTVDDPD